MDPGNQARFNKLEYGAIVSDLAFLMLDPNPNMRITARQLVSLISTAKEPAYSHTHIKQKACLTCTAGVYVDLSNLPPQHSTFNYSNPRGYPMRHGDVLTGKIPRDWDSTKKEWLYSHMWL